MKQLWLVVPVIGLMILFGSGTARADAATPTPTLFIQPPKPNSFPVPTGAPPWPTPALPTFPPLTPSPTLYNATAIHATDYAGQLATATVQVGVFHEPINAVSTPVAFLVEAPGTPTSGDLDTGLEVVGENVTLLGWAQDVAADLTDAVAGATKFATDLWTFLSYTPVLQGLVVAELVGIAISVFIPIVAFVIRAVRYLLTLLAIARIIARLVG